MFAALMSAFLRFTRNLRTVGQFSCISNMACHILTRKNFNTALVELKVTGTAGNSED
jgi:hypothetical protein